MSYRDERSDRDRDRYGSSRDRDHRERRRSGDTMPDLYSIFQGEIARVQPYGIFVRIPGFRKQGLVHKSQMSQSRIDDPFEVVKAGESVFCKVISLQDDKVGLSMKVVNQGNGKDLDRNNVETEMDEQRRKTGYRRDNKPISLGAVLDTTCRKCGGKGHLSQDCYSATVGKSYALLPDAEDGKAEAENRDSPKKKHKEKKEKKKHKKDSEKKKKKHKKKRRHHHSSDSSDSESDSEPQNRDSHKKRKHQDSSSDSDTDDDSKHSSKQKKKKHHSSYSDDSDSEPHRKHSHKHKY